MKSLVYIVDELQNKNNENPLFYREFSLFSFFLKF